MGREDVVGAGEPRDRVEEDDHIAPVFHQPLGPGQHHLGDLAVADRRLVEGRGDHPAAHALLHLGDLLRPLVDQQHDQLHITVVGGDRVGDVAQDRGLPGLRGRDDQAALPHPDRGDEIHDAHGGLPGPDLQGEPAIRIPGPQLFEDGAGARRSRCEPVDAVHGLEREVFFTSPWRPHRPGQRVALAESEGSDPGRTDVDVVGARQIVPAPRSQEAVAIGKDIQHSLGERLFLLLREALVNPEDQILFAEPRAIRDVQRFRVALQFGYRSILEFGDVHREVGRGAARGVAPGQRRPDAVKSGRCGPKDAGLETSRGSGRECPVR